MSAIGRYLSVIDGLKDEILLLFGGTTLTSAPKNWRPDERSLTKVGDYG